MAKLGEFIGSSFTGGGRIFGKSTAKKFRDPLGLIKDKPDTSKTAQEVALERRQRSLLDKEIEEEEDRLRLLSRGKLGRSSLLSGAPRTVSEAAGVSRSGGGASLLGVKARAAATAAGIPNASGRRVAGRPVR